MSGYVALVGGGEGATPEDERDAHRAGLVFAQQGLVVLTGGLGGVMGAAASGAAEGGGLSIGLLPTATRAEGHSAHRVLLPTGLGEMRNALLVRFADVVLAVGGGWGTLSEIALAAKTGTPVVAVRGWELPEDAVQHVQDIEEGIRAVMAVVEAARPEP